MRRDRRRGGWCVPGSRRPPSRPRAIYNKCTKIVDDARARRPGTPVPSCHGPAATRSPRACTWALASSRRSSRPRLRATDDTDCLPFRQARAARHRDGERAGQQGHIEHLYHPPPCVPDERPTRATLQSSRRWLGIGTSAHHNFLCLVTRCRDARRTARQGRRLDDARGQIFV